MQLGYVITYVDDVEETLSFYERALGQTRKFLHESGDYGELSTGTTTLAFSALSLMAQLGKHPGRADAKAPVFELAFVVEDVASAFDRAVAAGATAVQPPQQMPWGQITAYVTDLNGFLVELCTPVNADG